MTNTNIQGPIPLEGPGLSYRLDGNYKPGEYSKFTNVELVDGIIRVRRPIIPVNGSSTNFSGRISPGEAQKYFVGFTPVNQNVMGAISWGTRSYVVGGDDKAAWRMFDNTSLPGYDPVDPTSSTSVNNQMVAWFFYNKRNYWLTHEDVFNENTYWTLYWSDETTNPIAPTSLAFPPTANKTRIITRGVGAAYVAPGDFKKVFFHKDRLFIVTADKIYFSKATDPKVFTVPDGGFIDFESGSIYDAVALGDSIYIATTDKTYVYTYSVDPNEDGYLRPIYTGNKITALCVHGSMVLAASTTAIYAVNGGNFEVLRDLTTTIDNETFGDNYNSIIKMVSFDDSIFIIQGSIMDAMRAIDTDNGRRCYQFNTNNGSFSRVVFSDALDLAIDNVTIEKGQIVDVAVPGYDGAQQTLYIAVCYQNGADFFTRFYFMNGSRNNPSAATDYIDFPFSNSGVDRTLNSNATEVKRRIPFEIKIDNWTPDGSEYLVKKFRNVLLEGVLPTPSDKLIIETFYDKSVDSAVVPSYGPTGANRQPPYPYRIGLNQRSKTLSIRIAVTDTSAVTGLDKDSTSFFYISRLMSHWSFTQAPVG